MDNKNWYARPWYEWIGWVFWLALLVLFVQSAFSSTYELEPQAGLISWVVAAVLVLFAAIIWGMRAFRR